MTFRGPMRSRMRPITGPSCAWPMWRALAGRPAMAKRYRADAERIKAVYFKTFFNPATGVLAGWKSPDGKLHDYMFPWVNGFAIYQGLVPAEQAKSILQTMLGKDAEHRVPVVPIRPADEPDSDEPGGLFSAHERRSEAGRWEGHMAGLHERRRDAAVRVLLHPGALPDRARRTMRNGCCGR